MCNTANAKIMNQKTIIITALLAILSIGIKGQEKPEKVYSVVKVNHDFEWYNNQYELWGKEIKKDKKNEDAWINYYAAARMAHSSAPSEEQEHWMNNEIDVVESMKKAIKGTYAYYRIMAWSNAIWDTPSKEKQEEIKQYILKAYAMRPDLPDMYPYLVNLYEVYEHNDEKLDEVAKNWKATGGHTPDLTKLAYNALINTAENAIIITGGDNDTYPLLVAQHADKFRTDVTIINIYLATLPMYQDYLFSKLNIPKLEYHTNDFNVVVKTIINHIIQNKGDHPLYFFNKGIVPKDSTILDKLYNVGLVYQYSEDDLDNTSLIVNNFENKFLIDHLKYNYYQSQFPAKDKQFNLSYLAGLITLYNHYKLIGNDNKAKETKEIIINLTQDTEFYDKVKEELQFD